MCCVLILKTEVVKPVLFFFFFVQLSKVELEVSRGTYLFLECFQSVLFPPGTIWEFCLWDSWRDRADGKTKICMWAAFSFVRFAENGGGISALPDLANFSPTPLSGCCCNYEMMRSSPEPASPGSRAASFRQILAVSQSRAVSPDTSE